MRRTVDEAGKRTRAVTRKLKNVETLVPPGAPPLLELVSPDFGEEDDDATAADEDVTDTAA